MKPRSLAVTVHVLPNSNHLNFIGFRCSSNSGSDKLAHLSLLQETFTREILLNPGIL